MPYGGNILSGDFKLLQKVSGYSWYRHIRLEHTLLGRVMFTLFFCFFHIEPGSGGPMGLHTLSKFPFTAIDQALGVCLSFIHPV